MADLTITAADVVKGSGAVTETGVAGATITAGQALYKDASDSNKFKLADSNSATAAIRAFYGIALHGASSGQPLTVLRSGPITIGATTAVGTVYILSATAGGIAPAADAASGDYVTVIGVGTSTSVIQVQPLAAGAAVA